MRELQNKSKYLTLLRDNLLKQNQASRRNPLIDELDAALELIEHTLKEKFTRDIEKVSKQDIKNQNDLQKKFNARKELDDRINSLKTKATIIVMDSVS